MTLFFGLRFDEATFPEFFERGGNHILAGPERLLALFESFFGLTGHADDIEYLRIEQYRQAMLKYAGSHPDTFFIKSLEADQFATAGDLLTRRDELLLAGWDFQYESDTPHRLKTIAEIETYFGDSTHSLTPGFADRYTQLLQHFDYCTHPVLKFYYNEPLELLPAYLRRFIALLGRQAEVIPLFSETENKISGTTDLSIFKNILAGNGESARKYQLKGDGSLLIVRAKRAIDAATWFAKLAGRNGGFKPTLLIPEKNRMLDTALTLEGLPGLGILSASLARPSLQILKLVTAFFWQPIDPYKILEFLSLSLKPLHDDLAQVIAREMAQYPGLNSEGWNIAVQRFFDALAVAAGQDKKIKYGRIRREFEFWFQRNRYPLHGAVPKNEVMEVFDYLQQWSWHLFDESGNENSSLLVLSEQSRRIKELLEVVPEASLQYLELERIVRTIYEPSPVTFGDAEVGKMDLIYHPAALATAPEKLAWWNFVENEPAFFFSKWYAKERRYLVQKDLHLDTPADENARLVWQRQRPFLLTKKQLLLFLPESIQGTAMAPHPLWGDLEATFENLADITYDIDSPHQSSTFNRLFKMPEQIKIGHTPLGPPSPFLTITDTPALSGEEQFTPTSLETFLYYPYKWIFQHKIKLVKSSILSIVKESTLYGNLGHRVFEKLLKQNISGWNERQVKDWIDQYLPQLLSKEGAVLLMYGKEPDRINFENTIKHAAWKLVATIQKDKWQVVDTETTLEGQFQSDKLRGIADLILQRGTEYAILDLKWRGLTRRRDLIRNQEDIQLVLYKLLLQKEAYTGYYILNKAELLTRTSQPFSEVSPILDEADERQIQNELLQKIERTYAWRKQQIHAGKIEIRCSDTAAELDDCYANEGVELLAYLEMKNEDAPFDDYRTLLNLIK